MSDTVYTSLPEQINNIIKCINDVKIYEQGMQSLVAQELVLGRRHLEDAYFRLCNAYKLEYGFDLYPRNNIDKGQKL